MNEFLNWLVVGQADVVQHGSVLASSSLPERFASGFGSCKRVLRVTNESGNKFTVSIALIGRIVRAGDPTLANRETRQGKRRSLFVADDMSYASSTPQGRGESFKDRALEERWVVVMYGWQSEPTDGPKGGWSCDFWSGCNGCSGHLTHNCWM